MLKNSSLILARKTKNDEFYTRIQDIQTELQHYEENFCGKKILCNCNDGESSNFWIYLSENFERLGLKQLTCVSYSPDSPAYILEIRNDRRKIQKIPLQGDGDFRNRESMEFLKHADIIITNPPFSLFREYFSLLVQYDKKFLIIGSLNAVTYKNVFPLLKENKVWTGISHLRYFVQKEGEVCRFNNTVWYTNLECPESFQSLPLRKKYSASVYQNYDNLSAVEVGKISDIPADYKGVMGVPVSFLTKYYPEQFEIKGITSLWSFIDTSLRKKQYENVLQYHADGRISGGNGINTAAVIRVHDKPCGTYYTADNADGYLICKYVRVLIKRKD